MTQAAKNTDYARQLEAYDRLVATNPEVERKGATVPYTSVNGNMFSYLSKSGTLALRLPAPARESFLTTYDTKLCEQYGVVQVEYVEVPDALLDDTTRLKEFFDISYGYARGLKPKPTTRPKATKAAKTAAVAKSTAKGTAKGSAKRSPKRGAKKRR
jgi:hypothetical protein